MKGKREMKPTEETLTVAALSEQIGEAERRLHELQVEQLQLPERIRQAALAGDVENQIAGQKRLGELPMWIRAQGMKVERLRVERYDLQIEEAKAEEERLLPDLEPAEARAEKAIQERNRVRGLYHAAHARTKDLELDKRERERRLQALGGESATRSLAA
jgi:chromosome segregation ATPase